MPPVKEVRFFDENYDKGFAWYQQQFSRWAGQRAIGEASPGYMANEDAIVRIARHLPTAKLLISMRNPVDRAYSDYWMMRSLGVETRSFAAAVQQELGEHPGVAGDGLPNHYLRRGRYSSQLGSIEREFARSAIYPLVFEDFVAQPDAAVREVFRFLGVDHTFRPQLLGRQVNRHVKFRSASLRRWAKRAPRVIRLAIGRFNSRTGEYEPMDPQLRRELVEFFRPHNEALAQRIGADLSHWAA